MVYLGLGTNLGNKEQNLRMSVQKIEERIGKIVSLSAFYVTAPWGFASDNSFLNAVVCLETPLRPLEVLKETQAIERELGRTSKSMGGVYSDRLIEGLILPHPLMVERRFVMEPLAEIAPDVMHPVLHKTMKELFTSSFSPQ